MTATSRDSGLSHFSKIVSALSLPQSQRFESITRGSGCNKCVALMPRRGALEAGTGATDERA